MYPVEDEQLKASEPLELVSHLFQGKPLSFGAKILFFGASNRNIFLPKKYRLMSWILPYCLHKFSQGFTFCYCRFFFVFQSHHRSYLVKFVSRRESFRVIHHFFPMWQDWRLKSQSFSHLAKIPLCSFFACQYIMGQQREKGDYLPIYLLIPLLYP